MFQTNENFTCSIYNYNIKIKYYSTMTKKIQFHNRFCFGGVFCVSSVTDSVNRIILHQERFIDSLKENLRKKTPFDRPVHTNMTKAWSPRRRSLYKHRVVLCVELMSNWQQMAQCRRCTHQYNEIVRQCNEIKNE